MMNIETEVSAFVVRKDIVIPAKTLAAADKESKKYVWMRISNGNWLCQNGDKAYIISTDGDSIGCSCPAMTFHCKGNDVCKHIAALTSMQELPQKPITDEIVRELLKAGWSGDKGNLKPPEMPSDTEHYIPGLPDPPSEDYSNCRNVTSDEDGEGNEGTDPTPPNADNPEPPAKVTVTCPHCMKRATRNSQAEADAWLDGHPCKEGPRRKKPEPKRDESGTEVPFGTKTHTLTCPHCDQMFEGVVKIDVERRHHSHVKDCAKNPANMPEQQQKPVESKIDPLETENEETNMEEEPIELSDAAKRVVAEAEELGAKDIDPKYVVDKLDALERFKVSKSESERSVVSGILRLRGIKRPKGAVGASNQLVAIATIDTPDRWINLRAKCVELWDNDHDSIKQVGLIGDETNVIKFVSWQKADLAPIEADKTYSIENVVTNEYEGSFSVAFTKNTRITEMDEDIEVGFVMLEFTGIMVNIQNGSGLIKRCGVCNRAMVKGSCKEHGNVDGDHDLRIKAVLDNGLTTQNVLLNRERTEALTGITLESAKAIAIDAFDAEVVVDQMRGILIGQEFTAGGRHVGNTLLVESISRIDTPITNEEIGLLIEEVI